MSLRRATRVRRWPWRANSRASSAPMPAEAPVISTRPTSSPPMRRGSSLILVRVAMVLCPPQPPTASGNPNACIRLRTASTSWPSSTRSCSRALAVGDVPGEQRLRTKAELLEQGDRRALVDGHLRHQLAQAQLEGLGEALLDQRAAEAAAAPVRRHQHPQLADMPGPAQLVDEDRGAADHLAALAGDQADQLAAIEGAHPGVDDLGVAEVAGNEQQVVRRQRADEADQRGAVGAGHARDLDLHLAIGDVRG